MDALSLTTRERVGVWVSGPLPDTPTHWRRMRILIRGDFSRPVCTLSLTLSLDKERDPNYSRFKARIALELKRWANLIDRSGNDGRTGNCNHAGIGSLHNPG